MKGVNVKMQSKRWRSSISFCAAGPTNTGSASSFFSIIWILCRSGDHTLLIKPPRDDAHIRLLAAFVEQKWIYSAICGIPFNDSPSAS
jgi:hypothetical protein